VPTAAPTNAAIHWNVVVAFTIENVAFDQLSNSEKSIATSHVANKVSEKANVPLGDVEVALTAGSIKAIATISVPDGTEPKDMEQQFAGIEGKAMAGDVAQLVEADLVQSQSTALTGHVTVGAVELSSVQRPPLLEKKNKK